MIGGELMRTCSALGFASRIRLSSSLLVVPRTIESSITTTVRPSITPLTVLNFMRTFISRSSWPGWMKVRPM